MRYEKDKDQRFKYFVNKLTISVINNRERDVVIDENLNRKGYLTGRQ